MGLNQSNILDETAKLKQQLREEDLVRNMQEKEIQALKQVNYITKKNYI